jgi:carbamoyl-phosphate synthase small subunit
MALAIAQPALLVLEDGTTYSGFSFGATGTTIGEVVFNTGMTGYQEVLTDPSYRGQIVTFTYPELGNTGVNPQDEESRQPHVRGVVARNICDRPSNWRSTQSLPDYMVQHNLVGIYGIDTRALTRQLRSSGAMNGAISSEILDPQVLLAQVKAAPSMAGLNLVEEVTTAQAYEWLEPTAAAWEFRQAPATVLTAETAAVLPAATTTAKPAAKLTVVALDFGIKRNILYRLASHGCRVIVLPASASPAEILQHNPDGIFLSNGPGDPAAVTVGIATTKALLTADRPIFGICMGHQILSLALGGETFKLKFGHRGLNHPAGLSQRIEITSQNHGFAVDPDSLTAGTVEITHLNLNDRTIAGIRHTELPLFSVQYHPEASPGPHDADYLFAEFVQLMRARKVASA